MEKSFLSESAFPLKPAYTKLFLFFISEKL